MIKKLKLIFQRLLPQALIVCSFFLFTDCKRTLEGQEFFGPDMAPAPAGFYLTEGFDRDSYAATTVNFEYGLTFPNHPASWLKLKAGFSHRVTWTVTITGAQSGAVKVFTGTSTALDIKWLGESSNMYFFKKLESAVAVLSILGHSTTYTYNVTSILTAKPYVGVINGIRHTIIDDFENTRTPKKALTGKFKNAGDTGIVYGLSANFKVQGEYAFRFAGTDLNNNSWLAGINTDPLDKWYDTTGNFVDGPLVTDPSQLYFNIYVFGTGKANSSIQLKAYEREHDTAPYDQTINDGYVYDIFVNWTGWKLITVKYSDFRRSADPLLGGNGNGIMEPNLVTGMSIGLNSQPTVGQDVEVYMDYLILTENGPFIP